jgi:hypothetical protein
MIDMQQVAPTELIPVMASYLATNRLLLTELDLFKTLNCYEIRNKLQVLVKISFH